MSPSDPLLMVLAERAKVRPAHIWHCLCFMRERKAKFIPAAFAAFNQIDISHVQRMVAVIEAEGLGWVGKAKAETTDRGSRLPQDFAMPADWLQWAQVQRGWSMDVAKTEADRFADYWHAKPGASAVKLDWRATWRNWVRGSNTANGNARVMNERENDFPSFCKRQIEFHSRTGDAEMVKHWREKLEKADVGAG